MFKEYNKIFYYEDAEFCTEPIDTYVSAAYKTDGQGGFRRIEWNGFLPDNTRSNSVLDMTQSTEKNPLPFYSQTEERVYNLEWQRQEKERKELAAELNAKLLIALQRSVSDYAEVSPAEELIIEIAENYGFSLLGEVTLKIYTNNSGSPDILVKLCGCLDRFAAHEVEPWGFAMLVGLLNNKSEAVKEAAVILIENWASVPLLQMLENTEFKSEWLQEYVDDVIGFLKGR